MNASGQIVKYQVVGNLTLKYLAENTTGKFVEGVISNLDRMKQKVFSPNDTKLLDQSGRIRVKLGGDDGGAQKERAVSVLKYVWNTEEIEKFLPFLVAVETAQSTESGDDGDCHSLTASLSVKPNHSNGKMKEMSITGVLSEGMAECLEHSEVGGIDFLWSRDVPSQFMWSLKGRHIENECVLMARFQCKSEGPKALRLKMAFEIEDCGISDVRMVADPDGEAQIMETKRTTRSGEIILK